MQDNRNTEKESRGKWALDCPGLRIEKGTEHTLLYLVSQRIKGEHFENMFTYFLQIMINL